MPICSGYFLPTMPEGLEDVAELALDLSWAWNHANDALWRRIDPDLWKRTRNAWLLLQKVGDARLEALVRDEEFRGALKSQAEEHRRTLETAGWYQDAFLEPPVETVAYFSMEFGLGEALPIYSGGLGVLAGDHLKTASDLGLPAVGVGLLYQEGYFRQALDASGSQLEFFPYNDPNLLPLIPVRGPGGEWLLLEMEMPGRTLVLRTWVAQVGRTRLFLLDTNDPLNLPADRGVAGELYGGGPEVRLQQEMVLGIGGWRLLTALGIRADVCHLNEGHSAFVALERAKSFMAETGLPFAAALAVTRAGNLFTTHTPVASGFDRYPRSLVAKYLGHYADELGIGIEGLMALGRSDPADAGEPFGMARLAVRASGAVNGVSRLHGAVSRRIFQPLFPRWPEADVPVGHITNGIHTPSWDSQGADELWTVACGKCPWLRTLDTLSGDIRKVSDEKLWEFRTRNRVQLIRDVQEHLGRQKAETCALGECGVEMGQLLDPNTLTLGFARRFAEYKRPNLLLRDPDRFARLLTDPRRPVQMILAGKAHPGDEFGKSLIREWMRFLQRPEVHGRVIFLVDYDMHTAEQMVQGVDLWVNTPRRRWEACGTSGMKVLVNGGLNLSELDGWWAEAYAPDVGWALGLGMEDGDPARDAAEAGQLYDLLEKEVVPAFYERNEQGVPAGWVARMRESMARLSPAFSANRMVREYTETYYAPLAAAYRRRAADRGKIGAEIESWRQSLSSRWAGIHFGGLDVRKEDEGHHFRIPVYLGEIDPRWVTVELFADPGEEEAPPERHAMNRAGGLPGARHGYFYEISLKTSRPAEDYTPRVIPRHPEASVPLELNLIRWSA